MVTRISFENLRLGKWRPEIMTEKILILDDTIKMIQNEIANASIDRTPSVLAALQSKLEIKTIERQHVTMPMVIFAMDVETKHVIVGRFWYDKLIFKHGAVKADNLVIIGLTKKEGENMNEMEKIIYGNDETSNSVMSAMTYLLEAGIKFRSTWKKIKWENVSNVVDADATLLNVPEAVTTNILSNSKEVTVAAPIPPQKTDIVIEAE